MHYHKTKWKEFLDIFAIHVAELTRVRAAVGQNEPYILIRKK
jgi:hypothetical protein